MNDKEEQPKVRLWRRLMGEPIYPTELDIEYVFKTNHFPCPKHKPIKLTCEIHENLTDKG
jgi:hypothetical protein